MHSRFELADEKTNPENTKPDAMPRWFEDQPLIHPDPERLATSTAALRITLDRLERRLSR